eukprot:3764948-Rhodomonas_salina.2
MEKRGDGGNRGGRGGEKARREKAKRAITSSSTRLGRRASQPSIQSLHTGRGTWEGEDGKRVFRSTAKSDNRWGLLPINAKITAGPFHGLRRTLSEVDYVTVFARKKFDVIRPPTPVLSPKFYDEDENH